MFSIGAFESFDSVGLFRKLCLDLKNYIFLKKNLHITSLVNIEHLLKFC